ncbi:MAG: FGLLP motif-containing membrane protein [Tepidiformaceae bacterium]
MYGRSVLAISVAAVALAAFVGLALLGSAPQSARAACGGELGEPEALFVFEPPQSGDFQVSGLAPLTVSATWVLDAVTPAGSTASINWGDGSGTTPFGARDCGDGTINWPVQTHRHTYATPGTYEISWSFSIIVSNLRIPLARVNAQAAAATVASTIAPTAAPTIAPTAAPQPTEAPKPGASAVPPATPPIAAAVEATAVPTALATPTILTPSATPSPTATASPAATAKVAATVATVTSASVVPSPPSRVGDYSNVPVALFSAPRIDEISTEGGTIATNMALAGITLWVLFSSVLMNQVLQDNRAEIDAKTIRIGRPLRKWAGRVGGTMSGRGPATTALVVLGATGIIYEFLNPGFGANRESLLLFLSAVLGVGITTYACSGLEAAVTRRRNGVAASVRPYPASIAVAIASVMVSRLMHLQPGVVYGFVASTAITGTAQVEGHKQGSITVYPVVAALLLSVAALVLAEPIRANDAAASSFLGQLAIGVAVIVFIGGIEGVAFNMVPLAVTDGGKLFAWRKPVWVAIALIAAFLAWHVLLNRDRQSFDALRQASTLSILGIFVFYSMLSLGLWLYFRRRGGGPAHSEAAEPQVVAP